MNSDKLDPKISITKLNQHKSTHWISDILLFVFKFQNNRWIVDTMPTHTHKHCSDKKHKEIDLVLESSFKAKL